MNFVDATKSYETWLGREVRLLPEDLKRKHELMAQAPFPFLRATYYRWVQLWEESAAGLAKMPPVLAVGDLHIENFGTWRDADGRLVWGVNDFDEAAVMPYPLDLVRLAASIRLAPEPRLSDRAAAEALLRGYRAGLRDPQPALLDEGETWLRPYAAPTAKQSKKFW